MKKYSLLLMLLMLSTTCHMWAQGINFETGSWAAVKAKAKQLKKPIYLDVYTTWCGPCKMMATKYFPDPQAGAFYNKNFVCYKIDAEKGEGIEIAKTYAVTGYPTNLFIKGSGELIYRVSGAPMELSGFINNGQNALAEINDPMSLKEYKEKYAAGRYDRAFLDAYLLKNNRLEENNAAVLDRYVLLFEKTIPKDSLLLIVLAYQQGVTNKSYAYLLANKERVNELKTPDAFEQYSAYWYNHELEDAIAAKDEKRFTTLMGLMPKFNRDADFSTQHYYYKEFYSVTRNNEKLKAANKAFATKVMSLSKEEIQAASRSKDAAFKAQIISQLNTMNVPEEKHDELIKKNMENPQIKYNKEVLYANQLNEMAWQVYEENASTMKDKALVNQASLWAKKGMSWVEPLTELYLPIADTYAHLLFISGKKTEAIKVQRDLLERAKAAGITELDSYQQFLDQIK